MYQHPSSSRRGGRAGHRNPRAPAPAAPSDAAAKAAAAAKALHRRAAARAQEKQERQQQEQDGAYPPGNDVFRRGDDGGNCGDGAGSILKRVTTGHHLRLRGDDAAAPADREEARGEQARAAAQPYPHLPYPGYPHHPPPLGLPAYQPHPGHPSYSYNMPPQGHHPVHPGPVAAADDGLPDTGAEGQHPPHYAVAPYPPHFEGGYLDPSAMASQYGYHNGGVPPPHYYSAPYPTPTQPPRQATPSRTPARGDHGAGRGDEPRPPPKRPKADPAPVAPAPAFHGATRRVIGSHTPIHVPRAALSTRSEEEDQPAPGRPPPARRGGAGSVFRAAADEGAGRGMGRRGGGGREGTTGTPLGDREDRAHEILLSLSRSFERSPPADKGRRKRGEASGKDGGVGVGAELRPTSPEAPPRIQHWHKQSSDNFMPQPSPIKLSPGGAHNIDLSSSFTLFNESFDMNLEGLLGPNASFGLGPMQSLSFGMGLGASIDKGDGALGPTPLAAKRRPSLSPGGPDCRRDGARDGARPRALDVVAPRAPELNKAAGERGPLQVLRASPSSSFGNFLRTHANDTEGEVAGEDRPAAAPAMVPVHEGRGGEASPEAAEGCGGDVVLPAARAAAAKEDGGAPLPRSEGQPDSRGAGRQASRPRAPRGGVERGRLGALERHAGLFRAFSFLLPGAKAALAKDKDHRQCEDNSHATPIAVREREVARRRVNAALCAFGGAALLPPGAAGAAPEGREARKYREAMAARYYEDEDRLSWEIEEHPPIEVSDAEDSVAEDEVVIVETSSRCEPCSDGTNGNSGLDSTPRVSLRRSIGIMVYPAVNAFTAAEPGILTPALSEMNSSVDKHRLPECTPAKKQSEPLAHPGILAPMVTPDSVRPGVHATPSSNLAVHARDSKKTPQRSVNYAGGAWISNHQSPVRTVSPGSLGHTALDGSSTDLLFVDAQELRATQYRAVGHQKKRKWHGGGLSPPRYHQYPPLPLPYGQRKRISNAMFALSKSVAGLTDECATVLGEARKRDAWDFAVAQLITQVIVVTHCSGDDRRLDGLSKYLLTLGVAC